MTNNSLLFALFSVWSNWSLLSSLLLLLLVTAIVIIGVTALIFAIHIIVIAVFFFGLLFNDSQVVLKCEGNDVFFNHVGQVQVVSKFFLNIVFWLFFVIVFLLIV